MAKKPFITWKLLEVLQFNYRTKIYTRTTRVGRDYIKRTLKIIKKGLKLKTVKYNIRNKEFIKINNHNKMNHNNMKPWTIGMIYVD